MMKALFTAATGMDAMQTRIAVISNNIANVNTTGFKSSRANFQDLLYETTQTPGAETATGLNSPVGIQVGSGTRVISTQNQFTAGTTEQTGNDLDLAIQGDGFFQVQMPNGTVAYTRSGTLSMDATGKLVTQDGFPISPSVQLNPQGISRTIGLDGTITSVIPPASTVTAEGNIQIAMFPNESGLQSMGRNLFQETTASGTPLTGTPGTNGFGTLQQHALEGSNVNIADELIKMILAQRAYEMNSKVISTADQMLSTMSQVR